MKFEPNALLLTLPSPELSCPGLSLGPSWHQRSRPEELEGVSALASAEDPKLAVK